MCMGRTASVDDRALLASLAAVFRAQGYSGASLAALSEATGLQKASLYHRFPGGKPAMAAAVLTDVGRTFADVLEPLTTIESPADAVAEMGRRVSSAYASGRIGCVLDTMTLEGAPAAVKAQAAGLARHWIDAMTQVAARSGADEVEAGRRARSALVSIEGALVVSRVLGEPSEFDRAIEALPALLTGATSETDRGTAR